MRLCQRHELAIERFILLLDLLHVPDRYIEVLLLLLADLLEYAKVAQNSLVRFELLLKDFLLRA